MSLDLGRSPFRVIEHRVDLCVVGGGMAGVCAAVAAARHGATVALMQDRPMLGGNASSEIGVRILGADRNATIPFARETGLLEELRLENLVRNPQCSLSVWDLVVYHIVRHTPGLTLLLNCSCLDAAMEGARIKSVTGWQLSTQTWHVVHARIFADCSGDAILAPLVGAEHRSGREGADEYGESIAPPTPDGRSMGMTHILYARQHEREMPFRAFDWARTFPDCDALPWGAAGHGHLACSPWWCELGGEGHTIHDSEHLRDELFAVQLGIWDHIKNGNCVHREAARAWAIERLQFVPGRRESRRYVAPHMLSQGDIESGGRFADVIGHGGWTLDDHHPAGIDSFAKYGQPPTIHHPSPSPYGIPYRSLYSSNIENLMFAGRVAGCTHVAMSSTRVMGTCSVMGQAVGTAAAMACRRGLMPCDVSDLMRELQQRLLTDDVYLPGVSQDVGDTTRSAEIQTSPGTGDGEPVRDGVSRPVSDDPFVWMRKPPFAKAGADDLAAYRPHSWTGRVGDWVGYRFARATRVERISLALDSNLERGIALSSPGRQNAFPESLPASFRIETLSPGGWETIARVDDNTRRVVNLAVKAQTHGIRWVLERTHGGVESRLYSFLVNPPAHPHGTEEDNDE